MKSVFRSAVFAILVALLAFVPVMSTHAQADMCFGLKPDDCTLLQSMGGADMSKLSSFVMDYTLTAKITGTGSSDVDLSVQGSGPFAIDATKMSGASSNPTAAIGGLTMANTITASLTASGQTQKGSFEFRILDGTLYFMGDMATQGKWMSVDLTQALGAMMSNPQFSGALNASSNPAAAAAMDPEVIQNLTKAFMSPGVITAKRAADITIDGQPVAAFQFSFDIVSLLKAPEFKPAIQKIMASQASGTQITDQQLNQFLVAAQTMLKDTTFSVTQYVGTTDKLPHGFGLDFSLKLDPATAGMVTGSSNAQALNADLHFLVTLSKVGQAASVTAPAGAEKIDLSGMMGGSGSGTAPEPVATEAK